MTSSDEADARPILEALPYGIVLVGPERAIISANQMARELLPGIGASNMGCCHQLLLCSEPGQPCELGCLAMRAAESREVLPEVRIDVPNHAVSGALWVTATHLRHRYGAILHLRPGQANDRRRRSQPHWIAGPELRIRALGRLIVGSSCDVLGGQWLAERPGQVLKYLVCQRHNISAAEEIAHAIWPSSGPEGVNNTRHAVHRLRSMLEPGRAAREPSSFVVSVAGGYAFDRRHIWLDVDDFERSVEAGLAAMRELDLQAATGHLESALDLYRGEFLADEPYADWAYDERSRLHVLAVRAVRALAVLALERDDTAAALAYLERLCTIQPYDAAAHREFIMALCAAGRMDDAKRRYTAFARRMRREFDQAPGFDLKSLTP